MSRTKATAAACGFVVACLALLWSAPASAQTPQEPGTAIGATSQVAAAPDASRSVARSMIREAKQAVARQEADPVRRQMILIGGIALVSTYAVTIAGDYAIDPDVNFPQLWVPVVGPFLAYADYDNKVSPYYTGSTADKTLFIASGVVQAASAVVLAMGLARPTSKASRTMAKIPAISLTPTGHGGFKVTCLKRF